MSTDIRDVPNTQGITQTRFFGGSERGVCLQITQSTRSRKCDLFDYIQLTRQEAQQLANELVLFALELEVVEESNE